ncbi:MAG: putative choloylglycine hydrolase [Cytophagaceae bacterium]|jgi:predicted choloylglycine hydrolase|nr:putative choloylglycine hydrolase [Cytophagaceae bacterium]
MNLLPLKKLKKYVLYPLLGLGLLIGAAILLFRYLVVFDPPVVANEQKYLSLHRTEAGENKYVLGNNWLKKDSATGIWIVYIEGEPFERGVVYGKLCKELMYQQEVYFVNEIKRQVPSEFYLKFLKYMIAWFNRDMHEYVPVEYQQEIYGESFVTSDEFEFIGPGYHRMLNYHAAHDIGHALQNMNLVGCTAYAVWGEKTKGKLLVGRNFDFYAGEDFAKEKLISIVKPDKGYKYLSISWAGLMGVVSGMNERGLTVTLNAAKSGVPTSAATPVSIIAREVVQYAQTIEEAYAIIKKRKSFVSESFLISSALDSNVVVIEKTPDTTMIYQVNKKEQRLILTNHFQCAALYNDQLNQEYISQGTSTYRYNRVVELIDSLPYIDVDQMALIARDKRGLKGQNIGLGNEKSVNQLLAHHSILFSPYEHKTWISAPPYQLGKYLCFQLDTLFAHAAGMPGLNASLSLTTEDVPADEFGSSETFQSFVKHKKLGLRMDAILRGKSDDRLTATELNFYLHANPDYFYTYKVLGDYFDRILTDKAAAKSYYTLALTKEISSEPERLSIEKRLKELYDKK